MVAVISLEVSNVSAFKYILWVPFFSTVLDQKPMLRHAETWTSGETQRRELAWSPPQPGPGCQLARRQRQLSVSEGSGEEPQAGWQAGGGLTPPGSGGGPAL